MIYQCSSLNLGCCICAKSKTVRQKNDCNNELREMMKRLEGQLVTKWCYNICYCCGNHICALIGKQFWQSFITFNSAFTNFKFRVYFCEKRHQCVIDTQGFSVDDTKLNHLIWYYRFENRRIQFDFFLKILEWQKLTDEHQIWVLLSNS